MSQSALRDTPHQFLIVDDHEAILAGITPGLQQRYPQADIITAQDAQTAKSRLSQQMPTFVVLDLILPESKQSPATAQTGIQLLQQIMNSPAAPHLMALSVDIRPLIQIKADINAYRSGFVAMNKAEPLKEIVDTVDIALRGSIYLPPEVRSRPEFDQRWLQVLTLKYQEGLSDRAIAQAMGISDRTVRNYWSRIQDALNIYDDNQKDLRIQIQQAAKRVGLIP
ncbi:MAG: response regulator transcription factor [Phormidesmis sp.]